MGRQDIGYLVGGLGMFLFGTLVFEEAITSLVTKTFKSLLRSATNTLAKAIGTGFFVTSVLQSSSAVSLIVLAFVGAGIIQLSNGVGVILGTNIGAPLTDIVLGNLGLKFSLASIALPVIGIAGVLALIFVRSRRFHQICKVFVGLGLLFLGLGYMKDSMLGLAALVDFSQYVDLSIFLYFLIGLVVTIIMQSSSATTVLVLTAASSGIVDYRMGVPLIMGAFLGTTLTAVLGAIGPNQIKKQVAFSHVLFNLFSVILGFGFFSLMVDGLSLWFSDIVIGLSVFAIGFKIVGVLLFVPFVPRFTRLLQKLFPEKSSVLGLAIERVSPDVPEAALVAMRKDTIKLLKKVFGYIMNIWDVDEQNLLQNSDKLVTILSQQKNADQQFLENQYKTIKLIEEQLVSFGANIRKYTNKTSYVAEISTLYHIVSSCVYAAKYMKDIRQNIATLEDGGHGWLHTQYKFFRTVLVKLYVAISEIINGQHSDEIVKEMVILVQDIKDMDQYFLGSLTKELSKESMDKYDLSDVLHVNRYVYLSSLSIIEAVKDLLLNVEEKKIVDQLQ